MSALAYYLCLLPCFFFTVCSLKESASLADNGKPRRYFDTTHDVTLKATPRAVYEGFTKELTVQCVFSTHQESDFSILHALILSKSDPSSESYRELAILTSVPTDNFENKEFAEAEVTGGRTAQGERFIKYKISWPDTATAGQFFCEAHGLSCKGHPRMSTATVEVVAKETLDNAVLHDTLQESESRLDNCRLDNAALNHTLQELESSLDNCSGNGAWQAETIQSLIASAEKKSMMINYLNAISDTSLVSWQNHTYFLSQPMTLNLQAALAVCTQLGGYLLEIDSEEEYVFIINLIKQAMSKGRKGVYGVMVGSWDQGHEEQWTFIRSEKPMTTFHWGPGEPNNAGGVENCLLIYYGDEYGDHKQMNDSPCNWDRAIRPLCEIPGNIDWKLH